MVLSRDTILAAVELPRELVAVPEWGGDVYVRGMTGAERDKFELDLAQRRKLGKSTRFRASLVVATVCDEAGNPIFLAKDVDAIDAMPAAGLDRVTTIATRLSGIGADDAEELEKN